MDQLAVPIMNESDILIAVMGITGSGKSSFVSYLAKDAAAAVGHTLTSCTTDVTAYMFEYKGKRIFLIDTPGFDDTIRSDAEVLRDVATFLAQIYDKKWHLSGIVYLHRITDNRMSGSSVRNLKMFQELCGDGASKHIVLATTMWDDVHGNPRIPLEGGEQREQALSEKNGWWGLMKRRGSHVIRHAPNRNSALEVVNILLPYDSRRFVLDIQKELVDEHKMLEETAAGQTVGKELTEQKKKYEEDLQDLQAGHEDALRGKDTELAEMLRVEREESETKMLAADQAREALKLNYRQLAEQQIAQYTQLFATLEQQKEESRRIETQQRNERQETKERQTLMDQARTNIEQKLKEQDVEKNLERARKGNMQAQEAMIAMEARFRKQEEAAELKARALEIEMEKTKASKSVLRTTLAVLGALVGFATAGVGFATANPLLVSAGISGVGSMVSDLRN